MKIKVYQKTSLLLITFLFFKVTFSQTTIPTGNVSGKWTKANSPYKINGNIVIPNGSTLTIERGVRIEFAQFKYLNVDGRIIAIGGSKTTDSIWFTKQNTHDTGSWRGVKFINTANTNDTSAFRYCVFRNCKSLYDTMLANRSGGLVVLGYGKVKIFNSTFYNNEAIIGASVFLTRSAYTTIISCTFKNNSACQFWWRISNGYASFLPKGSAISIEYNSNAIIDSCVFKNNKRGKDYRINPSILFGVSTVDIEGFTYYKQRAFATISNSLFDGNEGVTLRAYDQANVVVTKCIFSNAPKDNSELAVYANYNSYININKSIFTDNGTYAIYKADESTIIISNSSILRNKNSVGSGDNYSYVRIEGCKILNNYGALDATNSIVGGIGANRISNTLIANNNFHAVNAGTIYNCTIVNNRSSRGGLLAFTYIDCHNSIIWGNKADSAIGKQIFIYPNTTADFRNCIIQNDTATFGWYLYNLKLIKPTTYLNNISANPQFINPTTGAGSGFNASLADFNLKNTCALFSPAINAGKIDTLYMNLPKTDLGGNTRFYEGRLDIGCYENISGIPAISVLKQAKNDTLCEKSRNAELTFLAIGKGLTYQWQESNNGGASWSDISGQTNAKLILNKTTQNQNTFLYRAVLNGSCDKDTSATAMIFNKPLPVFNIAKDTAVCKKSVVFKRVLTNGAYLWHTGNKTNIMTQVVSKDTIWWLQITDKEGCKYRDSLTITSNPLPVISIGIDKSIDKNQQLTLDAGAGYNKYAWNDGATIQTKTFFGKDLGPAGTYTLWAEVTNNNGCFGRDSIDITVTDNSAIHSIEKNQIRIYPQPASDILNIDIQKIFVEGNMLLTIRTMEGKAVNSEPLKNGLNQIPVYHLVAGLYLITITDMSTKETFLLKWVKG